MDSTRAPFSKGLYVLSQIIVILALAVKPSPYRWIWLLPLAGIDIYLVFFTTTQNAAIDNITAGGILAYFFMASDYILLTDVQRELHPQGEKTYIPDLPLKSRIVWAIKLICNPRGIGWTHERSSVLPPRPQTSRTNFIISQIYRGAFYILLLDIAQIHHAMNPCYAVNGEPFPGASLTSIWWLLNFVGFTVDLFAHSTLLFLLPSIVLVAFNLTEPRDWPHMFGKWSDAYTVRRFWSRTWHQLLSRMVSSHGKYFAHNVLHLRCGTPASSYTQLYIGFLVSALIHYGIDCMILGHWGGGAMSFFMSQAIAITFEDIIILIARRMGFKEMSRWQRLLGYVWVWVWFAYSTPGWIGPTLHAGLVKHDVHFSVIMLRSSSAIQIDILPPS